MSSLPILELKGGIIYMIKIKNVSTSLVSLYVPAIKLNRELTPGRTITVSEEEYDVGSGYGFGEVFC